MRRMIIRITLLLLLAAGAGGWWFTHAAGGRTVAFRTEKVVLGDLRATISASGTLEPEDVVDVGAQVAGQITSLGEDKPTRKLIDYGTVVEPGTVLARIDDKLYTAKVDQSRALLNSAKTKVDQAKALQASAAAKVDQAKANVLVADANLHLARARAMQTDRDWVRAQELALAKAMAQADVDAAESAYGTNQAGVGVSVATLTQAKANVIDAEATLKQAGAAVADAEAAVKTSEAQLEQDELNPGYCVITSPIKGVIIDRRVGIGQTVQSSFNTPSLFLLAKDLKRMKVWASVNEADIGQIHVGQKATFTVDAFPGFGSGSVVTLIPADADAIARECRPAIASVAPVVRARTQIVFGNRNWVPLYIYGTTPSFLDVREWELAEGRRFTDHEVNAGADACMVGQTIVRELFNDGPALGQIVRMNNHPMTVVGVLTRKGANMMGVDQDDLVLAPWRTIKFKVSGQSAQTSNQSAANAGDPRASISTGQTYPGGLSTTSLPYAQQSTTQQLDNPQPVLPPSIDQILVRVSAEPLIPGAIRQITTLLHERHRVKAWQPDDFNIRDITELSKAMGSTSQLMSALLLAVALISLVVGGVGIMNIMLVSVTERTREIGLRMAVGARPRDILRQFLAEAIVLCLLGGAVGILVGRGVSLGVRTFLHWPTMLSLPAIFASVGVSASVGVLFGYYPAWKASRLDPIEALRYE